MKYYCLVVIATWLSVSVAKVSVVPMDSEVLLKSDGNNIELHKDSGNGSSWLQMVLVFARHSSDSQSKIVIPDKPCNNSQQDTTERPVVTTTSTTSLPTSTTSLHTSTTSLPTSTTSLPTSTTSLPTSTTSPTSTKAPVTCKQGFVLLESKICYFFSTKTENWQDALKSCQAMGSTLAYPLNANDNTVLVNYVKKNYEGIASWYLGASDNVKEGQFIWAHSKSPIGYADWSAGQPDNAGNAEDCLHIYKPFGWKWNDIPCNIPYNYICQQ